jgi:hypothetical protein
MPRKSWWARLPFGVRMAAGTSALLLLIGGGVAGVTALNSGDARPRIVTAVADPALDGAGNAARSAAGSALPRATAPDGSDLRAAPGAGRPADGGAGSAAAGLGATGLGATGLGATGLGAAPAPAPGAAPQGPAPAPPLHGPIAAGQRTAAQADRNSVRRPAPVAGPGKPGVVAPGARPPAQPVVTTRIQVETQTIPYPTRTVSDSGLPIGSTLVETPGVPGEQTLRYLVTTTNGKQTGRRLLDSTVTRQPQPEVVVVGVPDGPPGWHRCPLDFCMRLGRSATCRHYGRGPGGEVPDDDDGEAVESGEGNDVALLGRGNAAETGRHAC